MATIDQEVQTNFMNDKHRAVTNTMFTSAWIRNLFTEFLKPYNLSSPQFNILRILRGAKDWMVMSEVKHRMVEKAPNATRLADKLLDKGFIERRRSDTDRRVVYVRITKKGLNLLKELDEVNEGPQVDFIDRISLKDARELNRILDKMRG